jgi:hypothetical protein
VFSSIFTRLVNSLFFLVEWLWIFAWHLVQQAVSFGRGTTTKICVVKLLPRPCIQVIETLGPSRSEPNTYANLPGLHRLYNRSKHHILGKLEDRITTETTEGVAKTTSPHPDKTIQAKELHKKWLQTYPDHTIIIDTDGSKLDSGAVGCGWAIYNYGDRQLHRLS